MKTFKEYLIERGRSAAGFSFNFRSALAWVGDRTVEQAVAECEIGAWLQWLACEAGVDKRLQVLAAGHCAATVLHLMKDERSRKAVAAAIAYGEGKITKEELQVAAADAAAAAADGGDAADAVVAYAAVYATYATYATYTAAAYAADAAYAKSNNQRLTAGICRKYMGAAIIKLVNKQLTK